MVVGGKEEGRVMILAFIGGRARLFGLGGRGGGLIDELDFSAHIATSS